MTIPERNVRGKVRAARMVARTLLQNPLETALLSAPIGLNSNDRRRLSPEGS